LRHGSLKRVMASESQNCYAFMRSSDDTEITVALNASGSKRTLSLPAPDLEWQDGREFTDLLSGDQLRVAEGQLIVKLQPYSSAWLL
jgi:hypothetical protein